jgi:hypothetical protein
MGRRLLVILAVLGALVGSTGLAQARSAPGGHHGHHGHGGHHHRAHGHALPWLGFHDGVLLLPPAGGMAPAPPFGSGPPPGYTYCDDPVGVYPHVLKCAHPWQRTPPLTTP